MLPELGDLDALGLPSLAFHRHPLLVGMVEETFEEVWMHSVQHIVEVLPRWAFARGKGIREVLQHLRVIGELGPDVLHRQLLILRYLDVLHILLLEELLLLRQDLLEEVLVQHMVRGHVVLHCNGVSGDDVCYLRCLSRKVTKSALLLSRPCSSWVCM